jgi:chromosome segregation protein
MRLKRLELFGFKSFADRTVLEFPHAVTGVVGPNGCGKSNVVDAIRWVLGETRPTSMRGGEMTDVIFKGSTSRPALGLAEVTLVLDNTCQSIPAHGAEVAVTRRVFRSGEGEYEIDGSKVRLKDVKDLLFDTGLGSRGYSVLEQGRIDAVLSANPLDRRTIFEEAAGVSRFRQRRKETEARLKRVDQDLERIDDVVGELETRVRSLKLQAGKARSYVELRDAWRLKGVGLAQNQVHRLDRALTAAAAELAELDRRVAQLREGRGAAEAEVEQREGDQRQRVQAVDGAGAEVSRLGGELLTLEERAAAPVAGRGVAAAGRGRGPAGPAARGAPG